MGYLHGADGAAEDGVAEADSAPVPGGPGLEQVAAVLLQDAERRPQPPQPLRQLPRLLGGGEE